MEKVKNDISPRFEYIRNVSDYKKVDGNFVSVEIENPEDFNLTVNQYKNLNALDVKTVIKPIKKVSTSSEVVPEDNNILNNPIHEAIEEYFDKLPDISEDLKKTLAEKVKVIYNRCV